MVAVWTPSYFRQTKVWTLAESYASQDKDDLLRDRPLIPLLRRDCKPKPLFASLLYNSYTAEELAAEYYAPDAVRELLAKYV
ncbi:MAG TPA: hypothetical protein VJH03_14430 [Blastocatellia bacterium]|nr:hypothetical protein [Blastocatellia bacterium]